MKIVFSRQESLLPPGAQEKLAEASLLVAGLGGLGCVVAEALARLGVGTLYLLDNSRVDLPDLNRQIFYTVEDLGRPKVEVAAERLERLLPGLKVNPLGAEIRPGFTLPDEISGAIDALDNWTSRFILEETCWQKGIFLVHAGLNGLFGQITSLVPGKSPRLSEIFAGTRDVESPPVVIPICLVLGAIQALEAVKLLLGVPETLVGKLLLVDLTEYSFHLELLKKPSEVRHGDSVKGA